MQAWLHSTSKDSMLEGVCLGVKTCEVFLCIVAIVRVRVYCVVFFVFFVLRHW